MEGRALGSALREFRVDYEQAKHLAIGAAIHSDAFPAGGYIWRVNLYPRGFSESDNGHYLSVHFELLNRSLTRSVGAIFEAFFIDKIGQPSCNTPRRSNVHVFQMTGVAVWGWSQFISVPALEANNVTEGQIRLVCAIMVINDSSIPMPPSELGKHHGALLDSADGTDVSFVIGDQTFHAHRAVLAARSPVFRALLLGSMAEATMPSITLEGIAPEIFKFVLHFVYKDVLPMLDINDLGDYEVRMKALLQLLTAADRYALDRLKLLCAKMLWDNMTPGMVATTLACADMYNCQELKNKCLDFIVSDDHRDVLFTKGYFDLGVRCPHLIEELRLRQKRGA